MGRACTRKAATVLTSVASPLLVLRWPLLVSVSSACRRAGEDGLRWLWPVACVGWFCPRVAVRAALALRPSRFGLQRVSPQLRLLVPISSEPADEAEKEELRVQLKRHHPSSPLPGSKTSKRPKIKVSLIPQGDVAGGPCAPSHGGAPEGESPACWRRHGLSPGTLVCLQAPGHVRGSGRQCLEDAGCSRAEREAGPPELHASCLLVSMKSTQMFQRARVTPLCLRKRNSVFRS